MTALSARRVSSRWRAVLLLPAGFCLLAGLDAALVMLELSAPVASSRLPGSHGVLLVLGFVGSLIALERAIALRARWALLAPTLLASGAVLTLAPVPSVLGPVLMAGGSLTLVGIYVPLWRRQADEAVLVQGLGAVCAAGAPMMWIGGVDLPTTLPWLMAFVVLTIAGERLELARVMLGATAGPILVGLSTALAAGVIASLLWTPSGTVLLGLTLAALVAWLSTHDIARRTVRASGLPRYMAVCMLSGYFWAAVAAGIWIVSGQVAAGSAGYDAVVHAVFLGFTMSMVMAHAPVILPAVTGLRLPYHPVMYGPVLLLQVSLALRIWWGDGLGIPAAWRAAAVLNIVALLSFLAVAAARVATGARR
ncbi:MAG: hypothetical protein ACK5MT_06125 [Actinomycetales bacterium]